MKTFRMICLGFCIAASVRVSAFNLQTDETLRIRGQYYDLAISEEPSGDRLYLASKQGIEVYSLDNPAQPVRVASFSTSGLANGVAVNHPYVYVGDVYGFSVWDVTDIDHPRLRSELRSDREFGYQERLYYRDGKVFISAYTNGLQVIDVSNPDHPFLAGHTLTSAYAWDMAISQDAAYIMDFFSMTIVDIRRPSFPVRRKNLSTMFASGAVIQDNLLYLGYIDGLRIMDISSPFDPVDVSDMGPTGSGTAETVSVEGDYAFVGHGSYIEIYDVSNSAKPVQIAYYYPPGHPRKLIAHKGFLYTVMDDSGFLVTNVNDPSAPFQEVHVDGGVWGTRKDVLCANDTLYLIDWNRGLVVYDTTGSDGLVELSNYLVPGSLRDCVLDGDTAYLVGQTEIQIVDVSDRTAPLMEGNYQTSGSPYSVSVDPAQNRLYLCDLYGFHILNISDPSNIQRIGAIWLAKDGNPYSARVIGSYAFVANGWKGIKVLDISDPSDPVLVKVWPGDNSKSYVDVKEKDGLLYFLDPSRGIDIMNVSDPLNPVVSATISFDEIIINDYVLKGDLLFVAGGNIGAFVYDVKNPTKPVLMAHVNTPGEAIGIDASETMVYVADRYNLSTYLRLPFTEDRMAPTVTVTSPESLAEIVEKTVVVKGVASDADSKVKKVEVSTDFGETWKETFGQDRWSMVVSGFQKGPLAVRARAFDWSGNISAETEDVWFYFNPPSPEIFAAGFETTNAVVGAPTKIIVSALVRDPWDGIYVKDAILYLNGQPTTRDFSFQMLSEGFLFGKLEFEETFHDSGRPDFSIVIRDSYNNPSIAWPRIPTRW